MEYIQCSHCNKKYASNDKVRAASGRSIQCKGCGESFKIVIFETPEASPKKPQAPTSEKSLEKAQAIVGKEKRKLKGKTLHKASRKFAPSAILGVLLIAISGYFFYLDRHVKMGQSFIPSATPVPKPKADPMPQQHTISKNDEHNATNTQSSKPIEPIKDKTKLSDQCKDIAAKQWLNNFTAMRATPNDEQFIRILDEGVKNSALVRKACGDPKIVYQLMISAQKGTPPLWLAERIDAMMPKSKEAHHF